MSKLSIKDAKINNKNVLIKMEKAVAQGKTAAGIITNEAPSAYRVAEIVMIGSMSNMNHKVGDKIIVFVQALNYDFDPKVAGLDPNYKYYLVFDEQIDITLSTNDAEPKV